MAWRACVLHFFLVVAAPYHLSVCDSIPFFLLGSCAICTLHTAAYISSSPGRDLAWTQTVVDVNIGVCFCASPSLLFSSISAHAFLHCAPFPIPHRHGSWQRHLCHFCKTELQILPPLLSSTLCLYSSALYPQLRGFGYMHASLGLIPVVDGDPSSHGRTQDLGSSFFG